MKKSLLALLVGASLASAQFLGLPSAYTRVKADTLSDTSLYIVQIPPYASAKVRSITGIELQKSIIASGGTANFDTLSCQTCYFNDTNINVTDSVVRIAANGTLDTIRTQGSGPFYSTITTPSSFTVQVPATYTAGLDVTNYPLTSDSTYTRALLIGEKTRGLNSANFGPTKGAGNFSFGGPVAGGYTGVIVNPTNTGYTALGFSQDSTQNGGTAPSYILRYNSNYTTAGVRGVLEIGSKRGINMVTGNTLNHTVSVDTTGKLTADSVTVTGHAVLETADVTTLNVGSTSLNAFEVNLAGDTITQSCGGPGSCAIRISGSSHEVDMDYPVRANSTLTGASYIKAGGYADSTLIWNGCGDNCRDTIFVTPAGPSTVINTINSSGTEDTLVVMLGDYNSYPVGWKFTIASNSVDGYQGSETLPTKIVGTDASSIWFLGSDQGASGNYGSFFNLPGILGSSPLGNPGVYTYCATSLVAGGSNGWRQISTTGCASY